MSDNEVVGMRMANHDLIWPIVETHKKDGVL